MSPRSMALWAVVLGAGVSQLGAERAQACSPDSCAKAWIFPAAGRIPSDQLRFSIYPARDLRDASAGDFGLYVVDGSTRREVALQRMPPGSGNVYAPATPLAAGAKLVFEATAAACNPGTALETSFEVTPAVARPDSLGTLHAELQRGTLEVATRRGSCSVNIDAAYADVSVALSDAAAPYADVIQYRVVVDGQLAESFSASLAEPTDLGRGRDRVYAPCMTEEGLIGNLALGKHRLRMRGVLPDGTSIETQELEIELSCAAPSGTAFDAGMSSTPDAASGEDPPARDASRAMPPDATDAAVDSSVSEPPRERDASPGAPHVSEATDDSDRAAAGRSTAPPTPAASPEPSDGCAVSRRVGPVGAPGPGIAWLAAAALGLALALRRRQRHH